MRYRGAPGSRWPLIIGIIVVILIIIAAWYFFFYT
jgi:uncharacterized membrane protein YqiK